VPLAPYTAATALGLLPSTVLQVGVGAAVPGLTEWAARAGSPAAVAALSVAVAGGAGLLWWLRGRRVRSGTPAG
jgi:uncharacterized membrane protein YdjX (TVP38/TMEM64 family)